MFGGQLKYMFTALRERLWVRPALHAAGALAAVGLAVLLDRLLRALVPYAPDITAGT
ncbi:MAG: hypothetical protein ACK5IB_11615 [Qingshengfaniella sp.]